MALKRKRSASELSSPLSTTSTISASSPVPFPLMANAPHLPSRTLKRARDSRPSDDEVHRRTLGLLYSAQRQGCLDTVSPTGQVVDAMDVSGAGGGAQRSLHSFWAINSAPGAASTPTVGVDVATACEDCGVDIPGEDAMDTDGSAPGSACGPCGRSVCGHCSVTNVDGQRRCLKCAGRKVWVGGLGWTAAGVAMC